MKSIYIILVKSHSKMGAFIRTFTRYKYNHVLISMTDKLEPMYSFARYRKDFAFSGGFIEESWLRYLDPEKPLDYKVFRIPVKKDLYEKGQIYLLDILKLDQGLRYSYFEAIQNYIGFEQKDHDKDKYTCLSFVVDFLKKVQVVDSGLSVVSISNLDKILSGYEYIESSIGYDELLKRSWGRDRYLERSPSLVEKLKLVWKFKP